MVLQALQLTFSRWVQHQAARPYQSLSVGRRRHQFFRQNSNLQFALETSPDQDLYYMTAQKQGVNPGDYIEISGLGKSVSCYKIVQLEHYSDPTDMWMATLQKMTNAPA